MFWKRLIHLFANGNKKNSQQLLFPLRLGRYSDAFPAPEQLELREQALDAFAQRDYLTAYWHFFASLRDEEEDNVRLAFYPEIQRLDFEIFQGSKVVTGYASPKEVVGEVRVLRAPQLHVALSRRLMEMNHGLLYSCFSLNADQVICMRFSTQSGDGYPDKIYSGLREIAITADRHDDLLLHEFAILEQLDTQHIQHLSDQERQHKVHFFQNSLAHLQKNIQYWQTIDAGGAVSYLILAWVYSTDYLLTPEGPLLNHLEKIQQIYFEHPQQKALWKNAKMQEALKPLERLTPEAIAQNFYAVKATFGTAPRLSSSQWQQFCQKYLQTLDWCTQNQQREQAQTVVAFMAGYALFHFGMPLFLRALMHLILQVFHEDFLSQLRDDHTPIYDTKSGQLVPRNLQLRLQLVLENAHEEGFSPPLDVAALSRHTSREELGQSIFSMLRQGDWGLN
ncbi:MAG: hypothetical protein ACFCUI_11285 [Bernardetiaceae bacterium]